MTNRFDKLSEQEEARLRQAMRQAGATSFPFVFFKDGGFYTGKKPDEINLVGAEFTALIDLASAGWDCWMNGKVIDSQMVDIMRDSRPPRPATLTNETDWRVGTYGPEDPWKKSWELPLRDAHGRVLTFKAGSEVTRKLVGELLADFSDMRRRPIIRLLVERAPGRVVPKFYIIGHDESDDVDALMTAKRPDDAAPDANSDEASDSSTTTTNNGAAHPRRNDDMNHDIPF